MAAVRLGKNHLRWCPECNLPILEEKSCPVCSTATQEVEVTPPGDVRPAFAHDLDLIRGVVDSQFGAGTGEVLLPEGHIVLMNKAPSLDRMDEVILDGQVVGTLRYDLGRGWVFLNRLQGAMRIAPLMSRAMVVADSGAVPFIKDGKNLMAPGVVSVHSDIRRGDEVVVLDQDGTPLATGLAKMDAAEMLESERGVAVKTKWTKEVELPPRRGGLDWDAVVQANEGVLSRRRDEAVRFIHETMEKNPLPTVVSFSGGKDSLATLLLSLDAGLRLPVLFVDTGLEFPETVEHVHETVRRHGLELIEEKAPTDAFFGNLVHFGPPAKDFRWCCKTNKLGPTVGAILRNFPDGVLSLIGQRRYESEARRSKPRVWKNPWTPGQVGASPIQEWNALHIWMYIFWKREPYNPWYERGLDRIGCFLCPASDMGELEIVAGNSLRYQEWDAYLEERMRSRGLSPEWKDYALWRWKRLPDSIREEISNLTGRDPSELSRETLASTEGSLQMHMQDGVSPCVVGYSIEAAFTRPLDMNRLKQMAPVMGPLEEDPQGDWLTVDDVTVFRQGSLISKGRTEKIIRDAAQTMFGLILRAEHCVGCSLCVARCPEGALSMQDGKASADASRCTHCRKCLGPCPAVNFREEEFNL